MKNITKRDYFAIRLLPKILEFSRAEEAVMEAYWLADLMIKIGSPKKAKEPPAKVERFTPPTLEEVQEYCKLRGNNIDPEAFMAHYTSNGWVVGKNKMKDWEAAVRTWERRDTGEGKPDGLSMAELRKLKGSA